MAMPELSVAREAAQVGGEIVARYFREGVAIRSKATSNLVTDADTEAEHAIVEVIRRSYPDHAILGEEGEYADSTGAENLWIIDPLDGTNNFAHAIPQFAVSVAYYHRGEPACGVVLNPVRDDWFVAERGAGAFWNDRQVRVNDESRLDQTLIGFGLYYEKGLVMERTLEAVAELTRRDIHGVRRFGAAALDLCMVGVGWFGAFFEYTLSPWDFAAGVLFITEAGGRVTNCRGEPLPLTRTHILATNGALHTPVLEVVRRYLPADAVGA